MKNIYALIILSFGSFLNAGQYNQENYPSSEDGWMKVEVPHQQSENNQPYIEIRTYPSNTNDVNQNRDNRREQINGTSDQEIIAKVRDILSPKWLGTGYKHVTFDVHEGNVNLRGTVEKAEDKTTLEREIKKVNGVRQVNNQIIVNNPADMPYYDTNVPQDTAATEQDKELNAKIRDKLSGGLFSKGIEGLVIKTQNGVVVILRTVDKTEDARKIDEKLKDVQGIRQLDNRVQTRQ